MSKVLLLGDQMKGLRLRQKDFSGETGPKLPHFEEIFPKNKRAYVTEYGLFILIFSICAKFRTKEKGYSIFGSTKVISTMYCIHIFATPRQCKNDL